MKKSRIFQLIGIGSVIIVIVTCISFLSRPKHVDNRTRGLRIATVLPLTGEFGKEGELARKVFAFAVTEYNKSSPSNKIDIVHFDGKYSPKDTIMAYNTALAHNPDAIIVYGDVPCNCLTKVISNGGIPVIAIAADNDIPYKSDKIFRGWVSTKLENRTLADFLKRNINVETVAILYLRNNFGEVARSNFKKELLLRQGRVVAEESFDATDQSMRAQISKIVGEKPDVIYVIGFGLSFCTAINQIYEAGYTGKICSNTIVAVPSVNEHIVNRGAGIFFIDTVFDSASQSEPTKTFVESFKAVIGETPTSFGVFEYEIIQFLASTAMKYGCQSAQLTEGLRSIQNRKTLIGDLSYDKDGEVDLALEAKQMTSDGTYKSAK